MSRELTFDGYWEGTADYYCDSCHRLVKFRFDTEEKAKNAKVHRRVLREKRGWITTKVDGVWHDFCCEKCKNQYIRQNTF